MRLPWKAQERFLDGKETKPTHSRSGIRGVLTVALLCLLAVGLAGTAAAQTTTAPDCSTVGYNGDGTATNPFEVSNVSQLQCVGNTSTATELSDNFTQVSDIDASGTSAWNGGAGFAPLGNSTTPFSGTFDGNGSTISDLTISRPSEDGTGLFDTIGSGGEVTNVSLVGATVSGANSVGTLAGGNRGTVTDASASGTVTGSGTQNIGGILGFHARSTLQDVAADVRVDAPSAKEVGGAVGQILTGGSIRNASASGNVTGQNEVGGLVGDQIDVADGIFESYATGDVTGQDEVGGLVGRTDNRVERSYATGEVSGRNDVGGLVGLGIGDTAVIVESYARGDVDGNDDVGGLAGRSETAVRRSYATGFVSGNTSVGGLIGSNSGGVTDSYYDNQTTGQSGGFGTSLTTEQMTGDAAETNMTGFAFGTTWVTTDSYPELFWSVERLALNAPGTLALGETASAPSAFEIVDGRTPSVTGVANYSSSDTSVITVSSPLEGVGLGTATVTAEHFGFTDSQELTVEPIDCVNRRSLSRGEEDQECPRDRTIERGGSREELDRNFDRRSDTSRRDRSRRDLGR